MTYEELLRDVMMNGVLKGDRTGTGTTSVFGRQIRYDLTKGFPLLTTKRMPFKMIATELLWFLRGDSNVKWLQERGCTIWDEWADKRGDLGPVYGHQWRSWPQYADDGRIHYQTEPIDQIAKLVETLKSNPNSRRMLVSAWNVADLPQMALEPCHFAFQCYVADGKLSLQVYQRSCDMFLGVPFNLASYALLTHLLAHQCNLQVGDLVWTGGDCHIYSNHYDQVLQLLQRHPRPLPKLLVTPNVASIFDYKFEDLHIVDYYPHPAISAPVAV